VTITGPELIIVAIMLLAFAAIVTPFALFGDRWFKRIKSGDE
jgi:hypothetical protein